MIFKIVIAVLLGFLIGLERESSGKSVGIRTVSLITLGATLFCLMSPSITGGDNSRIIAQVVSGISFICAGVIFKENKTVKGLTTGATLWAAAAIGCLVGVGMLKIAVLGTLAIISINLLFKYFKHDRKDNSEDM